MSYFCTMESRKIAFHTLGCKLNFSETSSIARQFREAGFVISGFDEVADIYVIHSCTVTSTAEKKSRAAISQARRRNPSARIAVIGCYSELRAESLKKIEGVEWVLGNETKYQLPDLIVHSDNTPLPPCEAVPCHQNSAIKGHPVNFYPAYSSGDRTRTFLKIQDGCDHFCTYCAIPYARGRSRSASIAQTLSLARKAVEEGAKEIVLTGVNIGDFGKKNGETLFDFLLAFEREAIAERLRISSIEPELLTDEIIRLVSESKCLMPHFHIPLQSGSDEILKKMKRPYTRELFARKVHLIRQIMPHACIAADVITGFPGETEDEFGEGATFAGSLPISYLHVFPYSERPGTPACKMEGRVSPAEKRRRAGYLHQVSVHLMENFLESCRGLEARVLFESDENDGFMSGFTENYIRVKTPFRPEFVNQIHTLKLLERDRAGNYLYTPVFNE
mgnify:CR=1 FL=1